MLASTIIGFGFLFLSSFFSSLIEGRGFGRIGPFLAAVYWKFIKSLASGFDSRRLSFLGLSSRGFGVG